MEIKVGEIIRAKRTERKMSLTELASLAGISTGYLSQIENGRSTFSSAGENVARRTAARCGQRAIRRLRLGVEPLVRTAAAARNHAAAADEPGQPAAAAGAGGRRAGQDGDRRTEQLTTLANSNNDSCLRRIQAGLSAIQLGICARKQSFLTIKKSQTVL